MFIQWSDVAARAGIAPQSYSILALGRYSAAIDIDAVVHKSNKSLHGKFCETSTTSALKVRFEGLTILVDEVLVFHQKVYGFEYVTSKWADSRCTTASHNLTLAAAFSLPPRQSTWASIAERCDADLPT